MTHSLQNHEKQDILACDIKILYLLQMQPGQKRCIAVQSGAARKFLRCKRKSSADEFSSISKHFETEEKLTKKLEDKY